MFARQEGFYADSPVLRHHNRVETWRDPSQKAPNWEELIGESNYIRAVQSLQEPKYPYCKIPKYEDILVRIIERNKLTAYDE